MTAPLPIYVINRAQDQARLKRFAASAAALDLAFTRIEAFDGHDPAAPLFLYRHLIGPHFWGDDRIKPGAFGCFLSHLSAWRRLIADGHPSALICEDDVLLTAAPAAPDIGFDILFCGDRMAGWAADSAPNRPVALPDLIRAMAVSDAAPGTGGRAKAPGADAYLLSRDGAARLIVAAEAHRFTAGVDWMMLALCLPPGAVSGWTVAKGLDAGLHLTPPLRGFVGATCATSAGGRSVLGHRITQPLATFGQSPAIAEISAPTPETAALLPLQEADPVTTAFRAGHYPEPPMLEMMGRWFPVGGTFVDIGAHIGSHTLFMLRHGGAARAIPFEFNEDAIKTLHSLITLNQLSDRADLSHLGFGLAEDAGRRAVQGAGQPAYDQRLKRDFVEGIRVRPGDALLRDEPSIAMLKIDVNGEEREVLKGLKKTLKRKAPLVVIDMTTAKSAKTLPLLARLGYTEAERIQWQDETGPRAAALFRPRVPMASASEDDPSGTPDPGPEKPGITP